MRQHKVITDRAHLEQVHPQAVRLVICGDRECWTRYLILDRAELVKAVAAERRRGAQPWAAAAMARPFWAERYGGPGQSFSHCPWRMMRKGPGRPFVRRRFIVIVQSGGLDI